MFSLQIINLTKSSCMIYFKLSYDASSRSEITSCIKIDKLLVVYRFFGKRYEIMLLTSGHAPVLLNFLNQLRKSDKMLDKPRI